MPIREITLSDLEAYRDEFLRVYLDAFTTESYAHNEGKLSERDSFDYCKGILVKEGIGFFALDGVRLAGFLLARPLRDDGMLDKAGLRRWFDVERCHYLAELAVDRPYRGQKLGRSLVETYLESVKDKNAVLVRTNESEPRLLAFYESLGFAYEGVRAEQYPGVWKRYFVFRPMRDSR